MRGALPLFALLVSVPVAAQQARPPGPAADSAAPAPVRVGLFGFGTRLGVDLESDLHAVVGFTLDVADLYTEQLRLRPSAEVGLRSGMNSYVGNLEVSYRFTREHEVAVPYVAAGVAVFGEDGCGQDPACPALWVQFALGFELELHRTMRWLLEYRGADALRRHRLFIGLTSRRGS